MLYDIMKSLVFMLTRQFRVGLSISMCYTNLYDSSKLGSMKVYGTIPHD